MTSKEAHAILNDAKAGRASPSEAEISAALRVTGDLDPLPFTERLGYWRRSANESTTWEAA